MTIAAYQTLYESSIAYGMRKALMAEQRRAYMRETIERLRTERDELKEQLRSLEQRLEDIEAREEERSAEEQRKHEAEVARLTEINDQLRANLEEILAAPSKK